MDPVDAILGLRSSDLTAEEAARVAEHMDLHRAALALGEAVRRLPQPRPRVRADDVLLARRRLQQRRARRGLGIALGVAAMALVGVLCLPGPEVRVRGMGRAAPEVVLELASEGPGGVRALATGATVAPDERVLFAVTTTSAGSLSILADGRTIWPAHGVWAVPAGTHAARDGALVSWRPDDARSVTVLQARVCPTEGGGDCVTSAPLPVRWLP